MSDEPSVRDEMMEEDPALLVEYDPQTVNENAVSMVCVRLRGLDMNLLREAILHGGVWQNSDCDCEITVSTPDPDDGECDRPILTFTIHSLTYFTVRVEPTMFDRTNPTQEELFQRFAALVKALKETHYHEQDDDHYEHPRIGGFTIWCRNEDQTGEEAAEDWAAIAQSWQV